MVAVKQIKTAIFVNYPSTSDNILSATNLVAKHQNLHDNLLNISHLFWLDQTIIFHWNPHKENLHKSVYIYISGKWHLLKAAYRNKFSKNDHNSSEGYTNPRFYFPLIFVTTICVAVTTIANVGISKFGLQIDITI